MLAPPETAQPVFDAPFEQPGPREGSPWTGLWAVVAKEMADHLTSVRMLILELIIVVTAVGVVSGATDQIRQQTGQDRFLFLRLFTIARDPLPAFVGFLVFLVPIVAIGLAFDSVNGEFNRRTMSRLLAQPIYRDALLFGKFIAGLGTLTIVLSAIWLLIAGFGLVRLGVPPGGEETARLLWYLLLTIAYGGVWLALALLCSIAFRQPATAALMALAVWLFFTIFWSMIVGVFIQSSIPASLLSPADLVALAQREIALSRVSPNVLYGEAALGLLNPEVRSLGLVLPAQMDQSVPGAPLRLTQSLLVVWPHLTGLIAETVALFAAGYVLFQRQEIRA